MPNLSKKRRDKWNSHIRLLKVTYPTKSKPVKVVTRKGKVKANGDEVVGYLEHRKEYFLIVVSQNYSWGEKVDTLIHEYAHALDCDDLPVGHVPFDEHSETWGRLYAQCYTLIVG